MLNDSGYKASKTENFVLKFNSTGNWSLGATLLSCSPSSYFITPDGSTFALVTV